MEMNNEQAVINDQVTLDEFSNNREALKAEKPKQRTQSLKPRRRSERTLEELQNIDFAEMTRQELTKVAETLSDEQHLQNNLIQELRKNYESICAQNNDIKEKYEKLRFAAVQREQFYRKHIALLYETSLTLKPMEVQ